MAITVKEVAEFVAPYVGMSYPNDDIRLFELLSLVQARIWGSGRFYGSTKFFHVGVDGENNIITPHGYNVLLGCNMDFKPVTIHGMTSLFHKNGPAEAPISQKGFNAGAFHLGDYAVMYQPNDQWCVRCGIMQPNKDYYIAVKSSDNCADVRFTTVSSLGCDGKPIYTYMKEASSMTPTVCGNEEIADGEIDYTEGVVYPIKGEQIAYNDIITTFVYSIRKEPTKTPVEYYLVDKETGQGFLTARLEPYETESKYKKYRVTGDCIKNKCILGLFKMSKPAEIKHESQLFVTDNRHAILCMAQSMDQLHNKQDFNTAEIFLQKSLIALREELREESPNAQNKMQIQTNRDFSKIKKLA
jgi:hypothetical protein